MFALAPPPAVMPTVEVSVSPAKAGTEAKPRPVKVSLAVDGEASVREIVVYFPKALRISNTGLPQCARTDAEILAGACKRSIAGSGSVTAVTEPDPIEITPLVGATGLMFSVEAGERSTVLHGKLSQASGRYTAKLRMKLPAFLRKLSSFSVGLRLSNGAASLFATRGCSAGGLPFRVELRGETAATLRTSAPCER